MNDEVRRLFEKALDYEADGGDREAFVRREASSDAVVELVLELLGHHEAAGSTLDQPAHERFESLIVSQPERIAEFEILKELGRGGMGVVYLAHDTTLDRDVALKVLGSHLVGSERAIGRFRHEAKAVAALNHPGVVPVYQYGENAGLHYLAMEYVAGRTLSEWVRTEHPAALRELAAEATDTDPAEGPHEQSGRTDGTRPDPIDRPRSKHQGEDRRYFRRVAQILSGVAEALEHAHRSGIVHRDIKPSNIIIADSDHPRLTDFGLAKILKNPSLTVTGDFAGTIHYMSPEQAQEASANIDHRTDIFSLGIVLYEALAYRRPFDGGTSLKILEAIRTEDPRRLRLLSPAVDKDLETICHKALEKRPEHRYQTAAHLDADLRCWLAGDPILARPASRFRTLSSRLRKRSRPILASLLMVVTIALAATIAVAFRDTTERVPVSILTDRPGYSMHLQEWDEDRLGDPVLVESQENIRLPEGAYRVTLVDSGDFTEATLLVDSPALRQGGERTGGDRTGTPPPPVELSIRFAPTESKEDMILIPTGVYAVGPPSNPYERTVAVEAFWIDATEVSNADYLAFVEATDAESLAVWPTEWPEGFGDLPVVGLTQGMAAAYAAWRGKRLPSAIEFEAAARGFSGRPHPWEGEPFPPIEPTAEMTGLIDAAEPEINWRSYMTHVKPVASMPGWSTPDGVFHLFGNVREYTAIRRGDRAVLKGGAWSSDPRFWDLSRETQVGVRTASWIRGFRCARSASMNATMIKKEN